MKREGPSEKLWCSRLGPILSYARQYASLSQLYTVQHLLSNRCCDCWSTNVEQCIMWCWMLKYAIQHIESCWTLLNENRALLYSVQQVAACCYLLNDVNQPFLEFRSRGLVERSNMSGWRFGCVRSVMAGQCLWWWLCFVSSSPGLVNDSWCL